MKVFNLILGAGFSKGMAGLPTGKELSSQFFSSFDRSKSPLMSKILDNNKQYNYGWGSYDHEIFEDHETSDFFGSLLTLSRKEAFSIIEESGFDSDKKDVLKKLIDARHQDYFNYEAFAADVNEMLGLFYKLDLVELRQYIDEAKLLLKEIEKKIYDFTIQGIECTPEHKQMFINFLTHLLKLGYSVNIFDLNHDEVFENIVCSDVNLGSKYQDFFDHDQIVDDTNADYKGRLFNQTLEIKAINHYKIHGTHRIIQERFKFIKLSSVEDWDFYNEYKAKILYLSGRKADTINTNEYHAFCYYRLMDSLNTINPLMTIGYGYNDPHIDSLLRHIYGLNTYPLTNHHDAKVVLLYNPENIEKIFLDSVYMGNFPLTDNGYYCNLSNLPFEDNFLVLFDKKRLAV